MNHLKFNVSFDFFTTILFVLFVFVYLELEMNIESHFGKVLVSFHCTGEKCTSNMMPEIWFPSSAVLTHKYYGMGNRLFDLKFVKLFFPFQPMCTQYLNLVVLFHLTERTQWRDQNAKQ